MAETWRAYTTLTNPVVGNALIAVSNGGSNILRIRRTGLYNLRNTTVTGVLTWGYIYRATGSTLSGTPITPFPYDTNNTALDTVTCYGHGGFSGGTTEIFRKYFYSSDEATLTTMTIDVWAGGFPEWFVMLDSGFGDTNVQSIALRTNESLCWVHQAGTVGDVGVWIEFTSEAP